MKYIILADSDNVEPFKTPRQLIEINGEKLIQRTIRLLKENGIKDIIVTSHDKRFDNLGAVRYEPLFNDYKPKENKGYWLSAFPIELINKPLTFLLGDVYYSENAIRTIVESETDYILFFCTSKKDGYSDKYIKHHDEPLGFKVEDYNLFKNSIYEVKKLKDLGKTKRDPIAWELYRYLSNIDVNKHELKDNYIAINDESCDIDTEKDVVLLQFKLGGNKMVRVKVTEDFDLGKFNELKELVRANAMNDENGHLYINDMFLCTQEMAEYITGNNKYKKAFAEVIEVIPDKKEEEIKPKKITKRKTKKKED